MISDEPDEDADSPDDAAIGTLLGDSPTAPEQVSLQLADWPVRSTQDITLNLDAETLAWFKARYPEWRSQIRSVLRAWAAANR